jgi:hypothetical protein
MGLTAGNRSRRLTAPTERHSLRPQSSRQKTLPRCLKRSQAQLAAEKEKADTDAGRGTGQNSPVLTSCRT